MFPQSIKPMVLVVVGLFFCASAQMRVLVNNVGYEKGGVKRAVIQSLSSDISDTKCYIYNAQGSIVDSINLSSQTTIDGWSGRKFKIADFTPFNTDGNGYKIRVGSVTSPEFSISKKVLQEKTGADVLGFFKEMRSKDDRDKSLSIFGSSAQKVNVYGGWWDANGDPGKHLSHLSYANYFNPQQIPLVVWALLHAHELQPAAFGNSAIEEAAWGADYLLRSLSPDGYFYMSVFDDWGAGVREICAWSHSDGVRSIDYKSAMREGAGVSIAALARASKVAGISGDSSAAQYLAGAKRAYDHLKRNPTAYQDDGKENIIDDYCGLLAASELYRATSSDEYLVDAGERAAKILARQSPDGWFYSGQQNVRPFYHAADEGFPVVALSRYYEVAGVSASEKRALREAVRKNLLWYNKITYERGSNPFEYVKMFRDAGSSGAAGDLARLKTATASRSQGDYTPNKAVNGDPATNDSNRWSSYQEGAQNDNQWIAVDLGAVYKINKVVLNWETAYGKRYRIEVSANGVDYTPALPIIENSSAGRKEHNIAPAVSARYVRMFGIERAAEYYGFSLYSFEVYGEEADGGAAVAGQVKYFVPHDNETGYWWQGENARIASMASAFILGARLADSLGTLWSDTLSYMASAQLDWILGRNPFGICMMEGHGDEGYPNYSASANTSGNGVKRRGGICNGITANKANQNDIQWMAAAGEESWQNWRWIEQWLPHNAWYLVAISSLSYKIDNPLLPDEPDLPSVVRFGERSQFSRLKITAIRGRGVKVELPFAADGLTEIVVYNIMGRKVRVSVMQSGSRVASIIFPSKIATGVYSISVKNAGKTVITDKIFLR